MSNRWFSETFLPSLFERSHNHEVKLTAKQVAICDQYMNAHRGSSFDDIGRYREWNFWTYEWDFGNRSITVRPPFPNGCSTMEFGLSDEEKAEAERIRLAEKEEQRLRMISFLVAHPDRMERRMERIRKMEIELEQLKADLLDVMEDDPDEMIYCMACISAKEEEIQEAKHAVGIA